MTGTKNRQVGGGISGLKRVPRPFDQADIDGELVETAHDEGIPFFLPPGPAGGPYIAEKGFRYGDVAKSSFGEDSERERDA
jgi:hypothetical protein